MKINSNRGFSLIELMIVVAIVGILASVAYPAYTSSILKGKRAEGRAALAELQQQQERYLTQRNCYLGFTTSSNGVATPTAPSPSTACGGFNATSAPFKTWSGNTLANSAYLLSADTCPDGASGTLSIADCVRVVATPIKTDAEAGNLRMTSTGTKDCTGTKSAVCWK
ncbi:type IV pilin protein [Polaromonas sp. UC242_47]|uniref:type IV pilin protein n=1 Tax=Polaromonas sp. UC242_47 TaxID=3374626 RepID=UPI00378F9696